MTQARASRFMKDIPALQQQHKGESQLVSSF